MDTCWLKEKRDLFLKNVVKDFLDSCSFFTDLKEHTAKYGVRYEGFDFWVGTQQDKGKLWHLKDICHVLWGDSDPARDENGFMLDWMIGAIFHEAMKLKENAYMIERYRKSYPSETKLPLHPNNNGDGPGMEFFEETAHEIKRAIKRIDLLLEHAGGYLIEVLKQEKENALLVRYLLEAMNSPAEHWPGETGPKRLLDALFPMGLDEAYCLAGESYLEGSWFVEARKAFEMALELNPNCTEARSGLRLLEKRVKEIAMVLEREYEIQAKNGISADPVR
ncbi:MAG: hypothetical protein DSZ23_02070 [Thermodesulfatator sp.]|nr:MAG: hypothetical protein DSZ23_02070 [Thermodesulfatator sp.]